MRIRNKSHNISIEEWKKLIIDSPNLKTMSEWMGSSNENETYSQGVLYIGKIPYGRIMLQNGQLDIDISKSYLSEVYESLVEIANKLNSDFYFNSNTIFNPNNHLPTTKIEINREKVYFDNVEFPNTWMCMKPSSIDEILKWLNLNRIGECKIPEINKYQGCISVIRNVSGLGLVMGNNLLEKFGIRYDSIKEYSEFLIKSLKKASKKYGEIQLYSDNENPGPNLISRFEDGKTKLFELSFEAEEYKQGKRNKSVQNLSPIEIASIWSMNPTDLIFFKELVGTKLELYN